VAEDQVGGRLPLLDTDTLDDEQRELVDYLMHTFVPWASTTGFRSRNPDGTFIGPFNALLRSPALAGQFLQFQTSEQQHTSLSERVRQVVILAVGAVWAADYELYAHSAVARHHGIPDDTVRSLAAGTAPATLSDDEKLAYRFT
jgi:4-carboxymuconolactone decarboxylase